VGGVSQHPILFHGTEQIFAAALQAVQMFFGRLRSAFGLHFDGAGLI
jgi:hypothetical protein